MHLEIIPMTEENQKALSTMDSQARTQERIVLSLDKNQYKHDFTTIPTYTKVYDPRYLPIEDYFSQDDYQVYFAKLDQVIVGQVILTKSWNGYGYIDDIRVGSDHKGMGIGKALIQAAETWAMTKGLRGMMLETQDINGPACRFYLRQGYQVGSVDLHKYKLLSGDVTKEIAILFYKFFQEAI